MVPPVLGEERCVGVGEAVVQQEGSLILLALSDHGHRPVHQLSGQSPEIDWFLHHQIVL